MTGIHLQNKPQLLIPYICIYSLEGTLQLSYVIHFPSAIFHSPFNNISSLPLALFYSPFKQYFISPFFCPSFLFCLPLPHQSHPKSSPSISSCTYIFILAQQQVLERLFECGIAQCVTSWVDSRVDITQPVANSPHSVRDTRLAEG